MEIVVTLAILQIVEMAKIKDIVLCSLKDTGNKQYLTQVATRNLSVIDFIKEKYETYSFEKKDGVYILNIKEYIDTIKEVLQGRYNKRQ